MVNKLLMVILAVGLLVFSSFADEKAGKDSKSTVSAAVKPKLGAVASAFEKVGVKRCVSRVQQVNDFLTGGAKSGTEIFLPTGTQDKDSSMLSMSMEVASADGAFYSSASFYPRQESDCAGVYETVTYWQNLCSQVMVSYESAGTKSAGTMLGQVTMLNLDAGSRIFLMPAGQGCVVIKKRVIF